MKKISQKTKINIYAFLSALFICFIFIIMLIAKINIVINIVMILIVFNILLKIRKSEFFNNR